MRPSVAGSGIGASEGEDDRGGVVAIPVFVRPRGSDERVGQGLRGVGVLAYEVGQSIGRDLVVDAVGGQDDGLTHGCLDAMYRSDRRGAEAATDPVVVERGELLYRAAVAVVSQVLPDGHVGGELGVRAGVAGPGDPGVLAGFGERADRDPVRGAVDAGVHCGELGAGQDAEEGGPAGRDARDDLGGDLEPRNMNRAWAAVCDRSGIGRRVRIHDLRHAAGSFLFDAGIDVKVLQTVLRHSRFQTTVDIYTHVFEAAQRRAAETMNGVLIDLQAAWEQRPERKTG